MGLPIEPGTLELISDEDYLEYRTRYRNLALKRDEALLVWNIGDGLNLAVPHLDNVPTERLAEVQRTMPNAFIDFREYLLDIIQFASREYPDKAEEWAPSEAAPQPRRGTPADNTLSRRITEPRTVGSTP